MKKIRILLVVITLLSLFVPLEKKNTLAAEYYLVVSAKFSFFYLLPSLFQIPTDYYMLQDFLRNSALIVGFFSPLFLLLWNLLLLKFRSERWKRLYRLWLVLALISSPYLSYYYYDVDRVVELWINPIILVIATGTEGWFWLREYQQSEGWLTK